jgi:gamma-glutamyltranspeptidase
MPPDPQNEIYQTRSQYADRYFNEDLRKQREWYSDKANQLKKKSQTLAFLVIVLGALTAVVQVFPDDGWQKMVSAIIGASIVAAEGWKKIARYDETWKAYRIASERMKHERRIYVNGAGAYRVQDEDAARLKFVESVENIISEEQQIFWESRSAEDKKTTAGG